MRPEYLMCVVLNEGSGLRIGPVSVCVEKKDSRLTVLQNIQLPKGLRGISTPPPVSGRLIQWLYRFLMN